MIMAVVNHSINNNNITQLNNNINVPPFGASGIEDKVSNSLKICSLSTYQLEMNKKILFYIQDSICLIIYDLKMNAKDNKCHNKYKKH